MITVYTSPTCTKCRILKSILDRNKVPFKENTDLSEIVGTPSLPVIKTSDGQILSYEDVIILMQNNALEGQH